MSTEPTPTPQPKPDWALLMLFALLAGGAVYALYYAFTAQSVLNHKLSNQNRSLTKKLAVLESVQNTSVKTDMLAGLEQQLAESRGTIATLEARLASVEKTAAAPAPVVEFTPPAAGETETLQQFLALKTALEQGQPYAQELQFASALPEVKTVSEQLKPAAENGLVTERELREALADWLEEHPAVVVVEDPKLESFNAKLKGLLSIKRKQAAPVDDYAALRAQVVAEASLDVLLTSARALPDASREPLETWINTAAERQSVIAALRAAETALLKQRD